MSTRGIILLSVGMLILGLLLGMVVGGAAGYFVGHNSRLAVGQNLPAFLPPRARQAQPLPSQPRGAPFAATSPNGARVQVVEKDSPAAKAGLQVGDVVTAVGGTKIDASHSLADLIQAHKPGDKVELSVTRGTQTLTLTIELGAAPQNSNQAYMGIRFTPTFPDNRRMPFRGSSLPNG